MSVIMRTFLSGDDEIIATKNSFIGFKVLANASGFKVNWVPMQNYHYNLDAMALEINEKTKVIYLANPDNPTGTLKVFFKVSIADKFISSSGAGYDELQCNNMMFGLPQFNITFVASSILDLSLIHI